MGSILMNYISKRIKISSIRQGSIDLSLLLRQLIPQEHVMEERDEIWTPDSLLNDIKTYHYNKELSEA